MTVKVLNYTVGCLSLFMNDQVSSSVCLLSLNAVTCCYGNSLSLPGDGWSGETLNLTRKNGPMMQHHLHFLCHWPDFRGLLSTWEKKSFVMQVQVLPYVLQLALLSSSMTAYLEQWGRCVCEPLQLGCGPSMCTCQRGLAQQWLFPRLLHWNTFTHVDTSLDTILSCLL